jgi:hypothetical protein
MSSLRAAVTTVNVNRLRRVQVNPVQRTAVFLEMDEGQFEDLLSLRGAYDLII